MADATANAIAQMLDIDLSTVTSDEAATQVIIDAVGTIASEVHRLATTYEPEGNEEEEEEEPSVDSNVDGNPQPSINANPENPQAPNVRKPNVPVVAASFSPHILGIAKRERVGRLNALISTGILTPAAAKKLEKRYCSDQSLGLSLSNEDSDGFDEVIDTLVENGKVINLGEQTGPNGDLTTLNGMGSELVLSLDANEVKDPKKNPLLADAESRAAKK